MKGFLLGFKNRTVHSKDIRVRSEKGIGPHLLVEGRDIGQESVIPTESSW